MTIAPRPESGPRGGAATGGPATGPPTGPATLDLADTLQVLTRGTLTVRGRLVDASNATLFGTVTLEGASAECVYKPVAGERPLWDFPDGSLAARERAAYLVAEATGWQLVPPTVLREGPFGPGMCQLWVEIDDAVELVDIVPRGSLPRGWLRVLDASGGGRQQVTLGHADDPRLRRMAVLDAVINNADRKGGHLLPMPCPRPAPQPAPEPAPHPAPGPGPEPPLYGVDHGVCFNEDDKLRTVLWGWAGQPLTDEAVEVLHRLRGQLAQLDGDGLGARLRALLTPTEVARTAYRVDRLLAQCRHPVPTEGWPAIPWPPF